jgi:CRISPR/Cas system CMR-associated protein Cmr5 small subunit
MRSKVQELAQLAYECVKQVKYKANEIGQNEQKGQRSLPQNIYLTQESCLP